jgi:hypothetical protein
MTGLGLAVDYLGMSRQRPPRAELRFAAALANRGEDAIWVLIPDTLAVPSRQPDTHVHSIGAWLLGEHATVQLLRATAGAGWFGLYLPQGASTAVTNLPLAWWGEFPEAVDVIAHQVTDLRIDGEPIADRLGFALTGRVDPTGDAAVMSDPSSIRASIAGTPHEPLSLSWTDSGSTAVRVAING